MPVPQSNPHDPRVIVISGSNAAKGRRLIADADRIGAADRIHFIRADLSGVEATRRAIREITALHPTVDALCLFANRQAPRHDVTPEGLERVFALYYLSRYLLSHELTPLLRRSPTPVIVNVAGVGMTKGRIHWDDLQLQREYGMVAAQLQAGRANDLLGVAYASEPHNPVRYVLYHPGFTESGDLTTIPAPAHLLIRIAARFAAHPIEQSIAPVHDFIDNRPSAPLTAIDRGRQLPLTLKTLDPDNAERLAAKTEALLDTLPLGPAPSAEEREGPGPV
ncbi:SDR family NAD(P)-dependent oxidoreductase [Glycomyces buryatensis]|uniref:SDR family NAD(P)-dependent oxidoreductase n=1 Tax=Glycomyces buryatensis TaxID=2570927 RepID=A0A4S8QFS4_9ACTN|nr:SDR family NAD(P)-dependent oxidoreductase [Glycomyces buryatensis]THV42531.1 SDR family NAD(P)-dependent oxidoreductase [Glycomyces buryatensis]